MITFKLNGQPLLLFTEHFLNGRFMFCPLAFKSLDEANALFDDFREVISYKERTDPKVQKQMQRIMQLYPLIVKIDFNESELKNYLDGDPVGMETEYPVLNAPHVLVQMQPSFEQFTVLDVAMDICNGISVGIGGFVSVFKTERVLSF